MTRMRIIESLKTRLPYIVALLAILFSISITRNIEMWKTDQVIQWDVISYYGYLPAAFIYNDLSLEFMDNYDGPHLFVMWPKTAPNGNKVFVTSMGMSFMYAPFFFGAHLYALNTKYDSGGYSEPYQLAIILAALLYFIIGLYFLCRLLLKFYKPLIASLVILIVAAGTNLFYYVTFEPGMSHVYSFSLITIFTWYTIKWYKDQKTKYAVYIGILIGLISLIRPTNIIVSLFFIFYGIKGISGLKERVQFFLTKYKQLTLILLFWFIVWFPQLLYWYALTGSVLYNSYADGSAFFFDNPKIIKGFFSYRNGWLVYSPAMIFSILGLFVTWKINKRLQMPLTLTFITFIYIAYSWWCWWYGGAFGNRAMIDMYGILALSVGAFFTYIATIRHNAIKYSIFVIAFVLVIAGIHHINKRRNFSIHWDSMTKEAFWDSYFRTSPSAEFEGKLRAPDYDSALKGVKEYSDRVD